MTHTLHRRGHRKSFEKDIVILIMSSKGINTEGSAKWKREFLDVVLRNNAINVGEGVKLYLPWDKLEKDNAFYNYLRNEITDRSNPMAVFDDMSMAKRALIELKERRNPLSFVISTDTKLTGALLKQASIKPSASEIRILKDDDHQGVFGKTSLLPNEDSLEMHSLCGHGMVPFPLIQRVMTDVKLGRISSRDGSKILSRPCSCSVFNRIRAEEILERHKFGNERLREPH